MRLYEDRSAPNPRRVRVFMAEKGVTDIEFVRVSIADGGVLSEGFLRRNPLA
ncbi:MAG TPA: glutathione S-transferase, partial [Gammaproteobacteria bacterium]|nr:glutathione S-transferase [Gammaproteobacteria bacterium]MCH77362.1 glutathione S-transferase [Gammaproteobacteria bacterium]